MKTKAPLRIDAHHHFWKVSRGDYGWLTPGLGTIYRDYDLLDLKPFVEDARIDGTVLVQAAPTEAETEFLIARAKASGGLVRAVVGWVDMAAKDSPAHIAKLAKHPQLRGLRPMIQDIADPDWMLSPALEPAFAALVEHDLRFDALVKPMHLPRLLRLADWHPGLRFVIDHAGKPDIARGAFAPWARDITTLATNTAGLCKVSGLVTEASPHWKVDHIRPYVDHLLDCFGPGRLIWGSDWPVVELAGGYEKWWQATETLLAGIEDDERALILGLNAVEFYGLDAKARTAPHS
jgi:L-fuconolactonase